MHEYSIAVGIINSISPIVEQRKSRAIKVWVSAGVLRAIMPDALTFSFDALKKNHPLLEDAELCLDIIPLKGACRGCGKVFEMDSIIGICPICGSADVEWTGGNELFLQKIEICINDGSNDGSDSDS